MFQQICLEFNLDFTKFSRDYYKNPIKLRSEKIDKDDLYYAFIENNLQLVECVKLFNVSYSKLRGDLLSYKLKKSPILQQKNRQKNCLEKYNVINPSCLKEVVEKRRTTNLERYGYINSSMNPEIKAKKQKTMQERYGGNAAACDPCILAKIKNTNLERYGEEWAWKTEEGKKKQKEGFIAKYGVENPGQVKEIQEKRKRTNLEKYGVEVSSQSEVVKEKVRQTNLHKYGVEYCAQDKEIKEKIIKTVEQKYGVKCVFSLDENKKKARSKKAKLKIKQTLYKNYGVDSPLQSKEIIQKKNNTCIQRYGTKHPSQCVEIQEKVYQTKQKNKSFNTSTDEEEINRLLCKKFKVVKRQYKTKQYRFPCDFYIPELDLYIEYQGTWLHGKEPYDSNKQEHQLIIQEWSKKALEVNFQNKKKTYYTMAIHVWTVSDPLKRQIAKDNNLNWKEFWTVKEVEDWINSLDI